MKKLKSTGLLWNPLTEKGIFDCFYVEGCLFHMLGAIEECGKFGMVSIGNSMQEANFSILKLFQSYFKIKFYNLNSTFPVNNFFILFLTAIDCSLKIQKSQKQ
jgi:hypothetical protein